MLGKIFLNYGMLKMVYLLSNSNGLYPNSWSDVPCTLLLGNQKILGLV